MTNFSYTIKDKLGIHARPAGQLVKLAQSFDSDIKIIKKDKSGDAKKIFSVMSLSVKYDDEINFVISGDDEEEAKNKIEKFLNENL